MKTIVRRFRQFSRMFLIWAICGICGFGSAGTFQVIVQVQSSSVNPTNVPQPPFYTNGPNWMTGWTFTNRVAGTNGTAMFATGPVVPMGPLAGQTSQQVQVKVYCGGIGAISNCVSTNIGVAKVQSTLTNWYRTVMQIR